MIRKTTAGDASEPAWFQSTHSGGDDGESCVEIATIPATVHVRDSEHDDAGPRLALTPSAWTHFLPYASQG
ncbi:DUF397 domain-containing protein [Streptomyces sp. NPDC006284]|uniref:DUF397 domain-containing protein n=1 Tax=Streptomyces sp. NPDC006284 TaxID=3156742 RepID=UPI0033B07ABB